MTRDQQDFSDYPQSLTAYKAAKSDCAADWTPRDVIIEVLRQMDSKEITPDALFVVFRNRKPNGDAQNGYSVAGTDGNVTLGMLHMAMAWVTRAWQ